MTGRAPPTRWGAGPRSALTDGWATSAGELLDHLEQATPYERRRMLDAARAKCGAGPRMHEGAVVVGKAERKTVAMSGPGPPARYI